MSGPVSDSSLEIWAEKPQFEPTKEDRVSAFRELLALRKAARAALDDEFDGSKELLDALHNGYQAKQ